MRWHASCKSSALGQAARCAPALSFLCVRQTAAAGPAFVHPALCPDSALPDKQDAENTRAKGRFATWTDACPLCAPAPPLPAHSPLCPQMASPCRTLCAPVGAGNKEGTKRKGGEGLRASFRSDYTARRKRSASSRRCVPFARGFSARAFDKWYEKRRG